MRDAHIGKGSRSGVKVPRVEGSRQRQVHFTAVDGQRDQRHFGLQHCQTESLELLVPRKGREGGDWSAVVSSKFGRVKKQAGKQQTDALETDEDDVHGRGHSGDGGVVDGDAQDDGRSDD